ALGGPGPDAPASRAAPSCRSALAALSASVGKGALAANGRLDTGGERLPGSHTVAQASAARDPGELEPGAGPVARIGSPRAALHGDGLAALPGDHADATGGASSVDVVYQPEGGLSDAEVRRERTQAPLLPLAEAIARRNPARGRPGLAV